MGKEGRKFAEKEFPIEKIVSGHLKFIKNYLIKLCKFKFLKMEKICVTGASGFIGRSICKV